MCNLRISVNEDLTMCEIVSLVYTPFADESLVCTIRLSNNGILHSRLRGCRTELDQVQYYSSCSLVRVACLKAARATP